jgi:NADH dehydrogenase (ubiquinone) 1 alpha subcomplex subunit 8
MLCKLEEDDPRRCINEGKSVTACTLDFFKQLKKHCKEEFNQYYNCIDKSSGKFYFYP